MTQEKIISAIDANLTDVTADKYALKALATNAPAPSGKSTLSVALSFMLVLITLTGLAAGGYYSVTQFLGDELGADYKQNAVVAVETTRENAYISATLGDAYFDNYSFAFAMDLKSNMPNRHVYLYPQLRAYCGERQLDIDPVGFRGDFVSGFLYPSLAGDKYDSKYSFSGNLFEDEANGPVHWVLTMDVLRPIFALESYTIPAYHYDPKATEEENHKTFLATQVAFQPAYEDKRVLVTDDDSIVSFLNVIAIPDGVTDEEWYSKTLGERAVLSGAFEKVDTFTWEYMTEPSAK